MPDLLHAFECSTTISHEDPLVRDHRVHGVRILPGVVFLDLVLRALKARGFDTPSIELRNVLFSEPIATTEQLDRRVRLRFVPQDAEARHWRVTAESSPVPSGSDGPGGVGVVENFRCEFQVTREPFEGRLDVDALLKQATRTTDVDDAYVYARGAAIEHLEFMKGQGQLYFHEGGVLAALQLSKPAREHLEDFLLHPVLLDSSTLLPFLFMQQRPELALQPFIPIHIESFRAVRTLGERVFVHVRESSTGLVADDLFHSDIDFYSREGQRLASLRKLSTKRIRSEGLISRLRRPEGEARAPEPRAAPVVPAAPATAASDAPVLDYLRGLLASELSVAPESLDETENFYSQGLDSTHLLRVVRRLEQDLACKLYPTLLFEHSTLRELADYLSRHHAQGVAGLTPRQPPASSTETPAPVRHEVLAPAAPSPRPRLDEPIAIIGLAGRYPQAADLDAFWDNLQAGRDCITEVPRERWNHDRWFDPSGKRPGTTQGKWGGFLHGIDQFDARLFNLSPREVELMDPQERLFLETAWQALEDSGQPGRALRGQRVGVFVGVMWGQYALLGLEETLKGHPVVPSSFASSIANRVSYFFDFRGPSLSLDTMCSSSLTALHLARESLLRGECEQALVGGVNLMLHPSKYVFLSEHRMLSTDGRCRAFGEGGSGYVPGEGVGAVLLKPLSRAEADGDFIHGVIRTTAVNHGGRSNGYTVPDPDVHATLISEALERSGVEPGTVGYIEAHGTGTSLGDPIELSGLGKAFKGRTAPEWSCAIGSVKSNVGHLEAAAGIAGITKVLLQLRHRKLAPSLHARQLNPFIDFASTPFRVQQELSDWPAPTTLAGQPAPRRAGLSSFGAGGANAHVILEEYVAPRDDAPPPERARLVVLCALKEDRLRPYAERLLRFLDRQATPGGTAPRASLSQIAYSSQLRGEPMPARLAFVASNLEALRVQLRSYLEGSSLPADCFQGTGRAAPSTASLTARGTEAPALRELAARWVEGQDVDWSTLHPEGSPRRYPLPTYPFAWRSYWLPRTEHMGTSGDAPQRPHPLLGRNTSTFAAVRFSTAFAATEPLLADHRVRGQPVLPGVVCLEMALAAARLACAGPVHGLRDITWASPGVPSSDSATLDVSLELQQEGEQLGFRLVGATGQLHAQGRLSSKEVPGQVESRPAPGDIQARCPRLLSAEDCYRLLASRGLEYGESLRPIRALHVGRDEALAALRLPAAPAPVDVTLPPGLLDGALQAVIGLLAQEPDGGGATAERTWLPFSLTAVHLHRPLPPECFVHVTRKARRKDVETFELCLLDGAGTLLVRLEDFAIREVRGPAREHLRVLGEAWVPEPLERTSNEATGALLLFDHDTVLRDGLRGATQRPVILVKPGTGFRSLGDGVFEIAPARTEDATLLLQSLRQEGRAPTAVIHAWTALHGSGTDQPSLEQVLERGLHALITFTRAWLQSRPVPSLQLLCVEAGDETSSPHAALSGFCKTINREHGALRYRVVRLGDGVTRPAWELLLQELSLPHAADDLIRLDRTGRARLRMQRLSLPDPDSTPLLRHRGVYLITGGRGGLGLLFARFLAQHFQARLVLAGRAPEDAAVREQLQALAADGAEAVYLRADVSREDEAQALVNATVSRFGVLHGVIHSAGVLRDAMVAHKRSEDVTEVLRPKVHGALHLDLATRQLPLDFLVLFSSLAGIIGNVGQCDYAFANRYLDQLARRRAAQVARGQRHGRSLSIAWPLWREGGMRVDAHVEQHLLRTLGMKPLGTRAGLDFFVRALHATEPVMALVEGDLAAIDEAFAVIQASTSAPLPPASEAAPADMEAVLATVAEVLRVDPAEVDPDASLEDHGFDPTTLSVLSTRLGERMGRALSSRQLAEHASVRALCQTLAAVARPRPPAPVPAPAAPPSPRSEPQPVAPNGLLRDRVRAQVMGTAASILKMDVGDVDPDTDLRDFGFDSISMTQLANRLREQLGVDLTAAMLFEHDRLGALVEHLLATHREALSARFPEELAPASEPSVEVASAPEPPRPQPASRTAPSESVPGASEPIAIIGMGGLFAQSPELGAFWRNLEQGRDLIAEIPPERWDWRALEGNPLTEPNRTRVKWGSFIDPVEHFDAAFFRITPREAALMDPQHRLFLQLAWNTLEDAGYRPSSLAGSNTGVFVGIGTTDYHDLLRDFGVAADAHTATGKAHSVLPNRISFLLDLHGPSLPVETACSSSLVAIHHAVQALRSGQCTLALVGGVNLLLSPQLYFAFSRAGMLSEDGRCKTFDASANGYVRGEGLGALLLKPLSRAEADGDTIHAVIRGTAINHGGRAQALTAPNPKSQADLLVAAYEDARVDPATVGYIEAHGTGTSLGDPIEIAGLRMAFERLYPRWQRPPPSVPHCALGSVKTNIGHLETAAGIAGVLKVALALRHRTLPASLHFQRPNPQLRLEGGPFYVNATTRPWPAPLDGEGVEGPRRAGVSSFGFGGTNAHVVLEEYRAAPRPSRTAARPQLVVLSARDPALLRTTAERLREALRDPEPPHLEELAFTLTVGREVLDERLATVVRDLDELAARLEGWLGRGTAEHVHVGSADGARLHESLLGGAAGAAFLEALITGGELDRLARLWVSGATSDLSRLYPLPSRRVSLPGSPFAQTRHWLLPGPADRLYVTSAATAPIAVPEAAAPRDDTPREAAEPWRDALHFLTQALASTARLDPATLRPTADFESYGMNSILIAELHQKLEAAFGKLPITLFFKYKNLADLAAYLGQEHASQVQRLTRQATVPAAMTAPPPEGPPPPAARAGPPEQRPRSTPMPRDSAADGDIAIIGMSGRYPQAEDLEHYWRNLETGKDCIEEIPSERWDYRPLFDATRQEPGSIYAKWGGFLDRVDRFDAAFFQISPLIARYMDPQERLFLETAWSCLEDAGYTRAGLAKADAGDQRAPVGVFVGATYNEYALFGAQEWSRGHRIPFSTQSFSIANRVSYALNLSGPSLTLDTACSSSLNAIHLACESLRSGACEVALAGGVNLSLHPSKYVMLCANRFASSDGRCRSFAAGGDGYVPGEGVGAVLLKPLAMALRDGDTIHAVIKGSAHNHDGKTHGYTVPNPVAQTEVISTALRRAGVDARTIGYVEAHGTGTSLGDPIEVTGLTDAFRSHTPDRGFCAIGSVKASIGHLESAAGIAQLHKVLLQMRHRQLAPTLIHGGQLNPHIDFASTPFRVQREATPWQSRPGEPLRAGISSFGAGGVNVHLVVESWEGSAPRGFPLPARPQVLVLSARTPERLRVQARRLLDWLDARPDWGMGEFEALAFTLQQGREAMSARLAFVASDLAITRERLRVYVAHAEEPVALRAQGLFTATLSPSHVADAAPPESELLALFARHEHATLARTWVEGTPWPWRALYREHPPRRLRLPTYPFAGERHWIESSGPAPTTPPPGIPPAPTSPEPRRRLSMREQLGHAPQAERHALLISLLGEAVARVLAYAPSTQPSPEEGFFDLGMESVQATQLVEHLEGELGIDLYPTLAFDHPTLRALADYLLERLPTVAAAPAARRAEAPAEVVLARQEWRDAPCTASPGRAPRGVLLVGASEAHARAFREHLHAQGVEVPVVGARLGQRFDATGAEPEFDPADARQVQQLLAALSGRGLQPSHVFHLGALDADFGKDPTLGFTQLLGLAQGMLAHTSDGAMRLGYLHSTVDGVHRPAHAALGGFCRALGLEAPRLAFQTLALGPEASAPSEVARLALANSGQDDIEIRYVAARRQVRELVEPPHAPPRPSPLRQGGAYVLTGGAGGLGLLLAEHLVRTVQARIALLGRGELDEARRLRLEALRATGAQVFYIRADVSDRDSAARGIREACERLGTVHGIIHAAGATRDSLVAAKDPAQWAAVLGPKVHGTLHLDEASRHLPLDFFALFSSTAAITGNVGQSDYAFANAFLDAFAEEREARRARGERQGHTVSFNWPLWAEGGMRVDASTLRFMERRGGLTPLPTALGLSVFEAGLAQEDRQRVVFHGARDVLVQRFGIRAKAAAPEAAPPSPTPVAGTRPSAPTPEGREPIAIIGMACRFPGGCDSPEALWRFLMEGGDAIVDVPRERWDPEAFFDADPDAAGRVYVRQAGFLKEAPALFDARLFGISPREATDMDPQQRLLLEVSWEALERAGLAPDSLAGSPVGVFVGMGSSEYGLLPRAAGQFSAYSATGLAANIASGRISHRLGLQGPALTVDTACSSSLMAVHLACDSLLRGESTVALAGGVNLMLSPYTFVSLSRLRALAPDGRCKTFDASADGYGRAEGGGMIVLKRLADARRDGDPVLAVLLGSAANHDGASSGLTVPNGLAQQALLRKALESAHLEPQRISYVEAHGTGTSLGDPIEMQALGTVYGQRPASAEAFTVGAVKAHLGHLEAAAGIAGLIKTVLCLQHRTIPKQPHLHQLNPHIRLERMRARLAWDTLRWEGEGRAAGVSAFGFSGTNVHVIVAEPPAPPVPVASPPRPVHLLPLSARDDAALRAQARAWREYLSREPEHLLGAACTAAVSARSHLEHRAAVVAADGAGLAAGLQALAEGHGAEGLLRGVVEQAAIPRLALAIPHAGDLRATVAALSPVEPVFAAAFDACGAVVAELSGGSPRVMEAPEVTTFRARYALLKLLGHWGYQPDALLADGLGLYLAACEAGALELRDALRCLLRDLGWLGAFTLEPGRVAEPRLRLLHTRTDALIDARKAARADTWTQPTLATGDWEAALAGLAPTERRIIVALGDTGRPWLRATSDETPWRTLLDCVADLYTRGLAPARRPFTEGRARPERPPPTYPFQRKPYWLPTLPVEVAPAGAGASVPPVFDGTPLHSPRREREFAYRISYARLPELADNHGIAHVGHLQELLTRAIRQHLGFTSFALRDVRYLVALHVEPHEEREVRLGVEPLEGDRARLLLHGRVDERGPWTLHAQAVLEHPASTPDAPGALPNLEQATRWDGGTFYRRLEALSFDLGESVKWVDAVSFRDGEALARFRRQPRAEQTSHALGFHPGILDACAQLFAVAGAAHLDGRMRFMVVGWESFQLHHAPASDTLLCHITFPEPPDANGNITGHFRLLDEANQLIAEARGHRLRLLSAERVAALEKALQDTPRPQGPRSHDARDAAAQHAEVVAFLTGRAAHHLQMEQAALTPHVPLRDLGLDSITGLSLRRDIEETLSLRVPAELLLEGPSIDSLTRALLRDLAPAERAPDGAPPATAPHSWFSHVVRRPRPRVRLFCFPYGGGGASLYLDWARLPEHIEVWPIQLPGRETRIHEPPLHRLEDLLPQLESALRPHLDLPFAFYGHSLGALLAYLLASRLRARGLPQPEHLLVGGASAPFLLPGPFLEGLQQRFRAAGFQGVPDPETREPLGPLLDIAMNTAEGRVMAGRDTDFARALLPMMLADLKLMEGYRYQPEAPFAFPITVMHGASDDRITAEASSAWRALTQGAFHQHVTPGDHFFLRPNQAQAWLLQRIASALPPLLPTQASPLSA